jgi:16S rRNA (adenine1518-N6/adenine1519-N6)-dimethyltransferase
MIQKEVAERMIAAPGSKTYGILSVLMQVWYDIEYLFTVNEQAFIPPPKVKSAVVKLTRNNRVKLNCNEKLFKTVVKTSFNQRRKMLRNSIKQLLSEDSTMPDDPLLMKRPEQLSIEQFEQLTNMLEPLTWQKKE